MRTQAETDLCCLLILDGHKTHTNNLPFIGMARRNNVTVLCLPPHCSHRMQPLDVSFMKPLMTYYTQAVENWLRNHPGRVVTTFQTAGLFSTAYVRAATMTIVVNGFRKTGVWPVDRNVFGPDDFSAAAPQTSNFEMMWLCILARMVQLHPQLT